MKKGVLPLITLLLLTSTESAADVKHRQTSWSRNQGILDRAMKKMEKEEQLLREAQEAQERMAVQAQLKKKEQENYEKNYRKAEMEAKKIMMSATDSEILGLRNELTKAPKPQH